MAAAGRADDALQVTGSLPKDPDEVPGLVAAGVTDFRAHVPAPTEASLTALVEGFRASLP